MLKPLKTLALLVLAVGAPLASRADLVTNGGFETGNFAGWTLGGNSGFGVFVCAAGTSFQGSLCTTNSGNDAAALGAPYTTASLSQSIATTVGALYTLTFYLRNDNLQQAPSNAFSASWGGATVFSESNALDSGYTKETITGLTATSSSTTLQFSFFNTPGGFYLDDVSVVDPPRAPEPGSFASLAAGLLVLLAARRRMFLLPQAVRLSRRANP